MQPYQLGTVSLGNGPDFPAVVCDGLIFALSEVFRHGDLGPAPTTLREFIGRGSRVVGGLAQALAACRASSRGHAAGDVTTKTPIGDPQKVVLIGINYRDHIEEMRLPERPRFPYAFLRPPTSLSAHNETIRLPALPKLIDWEAELGVVVGTRIHDASGLDDAQLLSGVAGYTIVNDVSARDWIAARPPVGIDWVMQKAWDRFQPTGPWITPAAFVEDPQSLPITLTVNGVVKQHSNTSQMVFSVAHILRHLGSIMTLEPGDIIATGTPAGVGFGRTPMETIKPGDRTDVTIGSLGTLSNLFQ
jgi:2-keto-4-pentenoate hydratase/2-oxohepta-3-ene-1,7-dioic acid hydratase in catechol pathway